MPSCVTYIQHFYTLVSLHHFSYLGFIWAELFAAPLPDEQFWPIPINPIPILYLKANCISQKCTAFDWWLWIKGRRCVLTLSCCPGPQCNGIKILPAPPLCLTVWIWHIMPLGFKCDYIFSTFPCRCFCQYSSKNSFSLDILWNFEGSPCGDFFNNLHFFGGFPQNRLENVHYRPVAEVYFA